MTMKRALVTLGAAVALFSLSLYGLAERAKNLMRARQLQDRIDALGENLRKNSAELQKIENRNADACKVAMGCIAMVEVFGECFMEKDDADNEIYYLPPKPFYGTGSAFTFYHNGKPQLATARHLFFEEGCTIKNAFVIFPNKRPLEVELVGHSPTADIAQLKFKKEGEAFYGTPAQLGNSNMLQRGDDVISVGTPFRIRFYTTFGKVTLPPIWVDNVNQAEIFSYDAATNPGISGGPVIAVKDGSIVGMTTMKLRNSELGLAVPSNDIALLWDRLATPGELKGASFGIKFTDTRTILAAYLQEFPMPMPKEEGVVITEVTDGGPSADKLKRGDLILRCNGKPISTPADLARETKYIIVPGTEVIIAGIRDSKPFTVKIESITE